MARARPRRADDQLIDAAAAARARAYAPYSRYRVGAAVLAEDGTIFTGANIENAAYPVSHCAERVAIHKAVSEGHRRFRALAVVSAGPEPGMPCGACRQVMAEFGIPRIIIATPRGERRRVRTLRALLPEPFTPDRLPGATRR